MVKRHFAAALLMCLFSATSSHAASVSFYLDQSNRLADGVNYLQVTIADGAAGAVDFTVTALQPLLDMAGDNFGIQRFAFNVVGGTATESRDVKALPSDWRARNGGRMAGFGLYDITLDGRGKSRQDPLTFSIKGVSLDTILSYVDLSTGRSPQGFSFFSARVAGLNFGSCGANESGRMSSFSSEDGGSEGGGDCIRSAFFGGTQAVPAPPAIWLLGTAVAALAARRLRR
jgi:hypothetical protein